MSKVVLFSQLVAQILFLKITTMMDLYCTFADGINQMRSISTYLKKYLTTKIKTIEWLEP